MVPRCSHTTQVPYYIHTIWVPYYIDTIQVPYYVNTIQVPFNIQLNILSEWQREKCCSYCSLLSPTSVWHPTENNLYHHLVIWYTPQAIPSTCHQTTIYDIYYILHILYTVDSIYYPNQLVRHPTENINLSSDTHHNIDNYDDGM